MSENISPLSDIMLNSQEERDALYYAEPAEAASVIAGVLRHVKFDERRLTMRTETGPCSTPEGIDLFDRAADLHDLSVNGSPRERRAALEEIDEVTGECQSRCASCPVMAACMAASVFVPKNDGTGGFQFIETGIWGGTDPKERAEIHHHLKDEEVGELVFNGSLAVRGIQDRISSYSADELTSDLGRSLDEIEAEDNANRERFKSFRTDYNVTAACATDREAFDIRDLLEV